MKKFNFQCDEVLKDTSEKCGLDRGLAKDGRGGRLKLWEKRPTCASTDKERKKRREREEKEQKRKICKTRR